MAKMRGWRAQWNAWRVKTRYRWLRVRRHSRLPRIGRIRQRTIRFTPGLLEWFPFPQLSRWRTATSIELGPLSSYIRMAALWRSSERLLHLKSFLWYHPLGTLNRIPWHFDEEQQVVHLVLRTGFRNTFLTFLFANKIIYQTTAGRCGIFKTARTRHYIGRVLAQRMLKNKKLDLLFSKCRTQSMHISARGLSIHLRRFAHKLYIYRRGIIRDSNHFFRMYRGWARKKERIMAGKIHRALPPFDQYVRFLREERTLVGVHETLRRCRGPSSPSISDVRLTVSPASFQPSERHSFFGKRAVPGKWLRRSFKKLRFKWTRNQASQYRYCSNLTTYHYARFVRLVSISQRTRKPYNGVRRMRLLRKRNVSSVRYRRRKKRRGKRKRR
jgi:hypothetical protein